MRLGLEKQAQNTCQSMEVTRKAGALNRTSVRTQRLFTGRREFKHIPSTISHFYNTVRDSCEETPILAQSRVLFSLQFQQRCLTPICYWAKRCKTPDSQNSDSCFASLRAFNATFFLERLSRLFFLPRGIHYS